MPEEQYIVRSMIGVGTTFAYQDPDSEATPNPFVDLDNALTYGMVGRKGTFVENTPIKSVSKTFIPGDEEVETKELVLNDIPGVVAQDRFLALAAERRDVSMRVTYPNNKTASFTLSLNGWQQGEPTREGAMTVTVFAQRTGDVTWGTGDLIPVEPD